MLGKLAIQLSAAAREKGVMIALAESCTGGLIASTLTRLDGASDILERGYITYSNAAKQENLGVSAQTLNTHGAVSEETAREMAIGALKNSHAQIALSVTGIAGPAGGSDDKPVGMVCFGAASAHGVQTTTRIFSGERHDIQNQATAYALNLLIKKVNSHE